MKQKFLYIRVRECHLFARLAAWKLRSAGGMAITIGNTIYLHNATVEDLLQNRAWLQHELAHILQFHEWGFWRFLYCYIRESLLKGYRDNRFEIAARDMEKENFQTIGYCYIIT